MAIGDLSFAIDTSKNETPQSVARKRALAEAILGETSHAPRDVGEGLNSLGQAIMYRRLMSGVTGAENAGNTGAAKVFQSLFGDQFPAAPAASTAPPGTPDASTVPDHPVPPVDVGAADPRQLAPQMASSGDTSALMAAISDPAQRAALPAGMRNNNPGNIKFVGQHVPGIVGPSQNTDQGDPQAVFDTPESGMRAMYGLLGRKYAGGKTTANDIIAGQGGWTPGNFQAAANVAHNAGLKPDQDINFNDPQAAARFMRGLMLQEHGNASKLYPDSLIQSAIGGQPSTPPAVSAVNALAAGQAPNAIPNLPDQAPIPQQAPVQVASNDPTAGMGMPYAPAAMPGGLGAIQQEIASQPPMDAKAAIARAMAGKGQSTPPEMGPQAEGPSVSPQGNPDVVNAGLWPRGGQRVLDAMMQQQSMTGGAPMGMQGPSGAPIAPQAVQPPPAPVDVPMPPQADAGGLAPQQAAPPLPPPTTVQDHPIAPPQAPDLSQLPAMAGGNSDVVAPGSQQGPSIEQLMQAAGNPWVMQKYGPVVDALLQQKMKQGDPSYALDLAKKRMDIQLEQQQLGGAFRGDSLDAQAWNILQTRDPSSKEYQTAYSIVSQPKTQMVQTANGMVPIQTPPQLPGWLKAPGDAGGPSVAPAGSAVPGNPAPSNGPAAANTPAGSMATAGPALPGTKQPATEMQARNGAIGRILLNEVPTLGANFKALSDPKGQFLNAIPGGMGNAWQSPEYQQAANAVKASVANVLYSLSGASSNPGEVMNQIGILTPAFGDAPATIDAKLQRFKTYVRAISSEANDPELSKSVEDAISKMDMPAAPNEAQQAAPVPAPKAGTVDGGYRFKGGDPADKSNWEPVQ